MPTPDSSQPPNRKLRWYQFSLRTLLVCVTLFGIACSWFAVKMRQAKRQRKAVDAIVKSGGRALYDFNLDICETRTFDDGYDDVDRSSFREIESDPKPPVPDWLRNWLGGDLFSNVISVRVGDNGTLQPLTDLPYVRVVTLGKWWDPAQTRTGDGRTPDPQWEKLESLSRLRELHLAGSPITDAEMEYLRGLTQLELLSLNDTQITDKGLACLKGMTKLRNLSLSRCHQITDVGLSDLKGLTQLEGIDLRGDTRITDAGLGNLRELSHLRELVLVETSVTNAGMQHLQGLTAMQQLYLQGTQVDEDGLMLLQRLTDLRALCLAEGYGCVGAGAKCLHAFPHLRILSMSCTDDALPYLKPLKELTWLSLNGDQITDNGLKAIKELTQVKLLTLEDTKISNDGLSNLRKSLPNTEISTEPIH